MNGEDYMKECLRQLENNQHYETLDEDSTRHYNEEIKQILEQGSNIYITDGKTLMVLKTKFPRAANFYKLPKIYRKTHQQDQ